MAEVEQPKQSEVKPRRRWLRLALLSLLLILVGLGAAPFIYISQAGGLSGLVRDKISTRLGGVPVAVADVEIEVRLPSFGVTVEALGVEIDLDDHSLKLPRASAVFSPETLLKGTPSDVVLSGIGVVGQCLGSGWIDLPSMCRGFGIRPLGSRAHVAGARSQL